MWPPSGWPHFFCGGGFAGLCVVDVAGRCGPLHLFGGLDAVLVCSPVGDGLLDGFGLEPLGEGFVDEGGKLVVGGEAEGDELAGG